MGESDKDLTKTYGPLAPFSDYHRHDHIRYISADGTQQSGTIVWVQAATDAISIKYVVDPDDPMSFLDFVVPGDVIQDWDVTQDQVLTRCPYCRQMHPANQVEQCPLKPGREV